VTTQEQEAEAADEAESTSQFLELDSLVSVITASVSDGVFASAVGAAVIGSVGVESTAPPTDTITAERNAQRAAELLEDQKFQAQIIYILVSMIILLILVAISTNYC